MLAMEGVTQVRRQLFGMIVAATSVVAAVGLGAPSAFAAPTFTVAPGGPFNASLNAGTTAEFHDLTNNKTLFCAASNASGSFTAGTGLTVIGTITSLTSTGCTGLGGVVTAGTATSNATPANPWSITGTGYNAAISGGQTSSTITAPGTGIGATLNLTVAGARCVATVGSANVAAPANAAALYDNASGLLAVTSAANLRVLAVTAACLGLLGAGDVLTYYTAPTPGAFITNGYTVNPQQRITSP
jgi:hypothetical protein